ncbi:spermidine/putrescine ABC transporter substrate-binding protein [Candidatus Dependentiae bacterium]|nr:MAG: spermidine/putrescine ABC transporter substrate-binding protein [Candidatus Dependentiae bacterium]
MFLTKFLSMLARFFIVIFWCVLFIAFLYTPHLGRFLRSERSLSIFTWSSLLDPIYLKKFEYETGIRLYVSYYESNDELLSKMQSTKGTGYDLIFPSDYMLVMLHKKGYLKKIDKTRLNFLEKLDPKLLGHYFDSKNEYSIPYFWAVYGLGVDLEYYKGKIPEATWGLVFDEKIMPPTISMTDGIRESVYIAGQYLFGSIDALKEPANLEKVKNLLIAQKKHVEVYSEERSEDILLAKSCPVVVGLSNDIWRATRQNPNIIFLIPKEGSFLDIDSIVIPKTTEKDDLIYEFINYLYRDEVFAHHVQKYGLCPTIANSEVEERENFCPSGQQFKLLHFFKDIVSKSKLNEVWVAVMAS